MLDSGQPNDDANFETLEARLRSDRPELGADRLEAIRGRISRRALTPSSGRRPTVVVAACLSLGVLFSGSGTALAVSGLSGDGNAVRQQYDPSSAPSTGGAAGTDPSGSPTLGGAPSRPADPADPADPGTASPFDGNGSDDNGSPDQGGVAGVTASSPKSTSTTAAAPTINTQVSPSSVTTQVAATRSSGQLPFTGFAAIPLLLIGGALLMTGVLLRRRTREEQY